MVQIKDGTHEVAHIYMDENYKYLSHALFEGDKPDKASRLKPDATDSIPKRGLNVPSIRF